MFQNNGFAPPLCSAVNLSHSRCDRFPKIRIHARAPFLPVLVRVNAPTHNQKMVWQLVTARYTLPTAAPLAFPVPGRTPSLTIFLEIRFSQTSIDRFIDSLRICRWEAPPTENRYDRIGRRFTQQHCAQRLVYLDSPSVTEIVQRKNPVWLLLHQIAGGACVDPVECGPSCRWDALYGGSPRE